LEVQLDNAIYESTKASVKMLTRYAAFAFAEHDIRVNAVAPGHTANEFKEGLTEHQK
jgi:NAD(P)-dependent dehydrogenase (short-subunit alcohol dehydrogenase family)